MIRALPLAFAAVLASACTRNEAPGNDRAATFAEHHPLAELTPPEQAAREADAAQVFPAAMTTQEIAQVIDPDAACSFGYTAAGRPVIAAAGTAGVIKLNGKVARLEALTPPDAAGMTLAAGPIEARITPEDVEDSKPAPDGGVQREADLVFRLDGGEKRGFRGYYACSGDG